MGVGSAVGGNDLGATAFLLEIGGVCVALGYPGLRAARRARRAERT